MSLGCEPGPGRQSGLRFWEAPRTALVLVSVCLPGLVVAALALHSWGWAGLGAVLSPSPPWVTRGTAVVASSSAAVLLTPASRLALLCWGHSWAYLPHLCLLGPAGGTRALPQPVTIWEEGPLPHYWDLRGAAQALEHSERGGLGSWGLVRLAFLPGSLQ